MARGMRRARRRLIAAAATALLAPAALLSSPVGPASAADTGTGPDRLVPLRLGSLGSGGRATAIDGDVVVGNAVVGYGPREMDEMGNWFRPARFHAVVWNLRNQDTTPLDLGTLGGVESWAVAVEGTWVVGNSQTADGKTRAFAVDVAEDHPTMIDLGALAGGSFSYATAVDDGIVVGHSFVEGWRAQAFAIDLNDVRPTMLRLGNADSSYATAVDDGVVAGHARSHQEQRSYAFAADVSSAPVTVRDLGSLGGDGETRVTAVDGGVVVGFSYPPDTEADPGQVGLAQAFAVDFAEPTGDMRNLGSGDRYSQSQATDIENGTVVGGEWDLLSSEKYGFAYDMRTESRRRVLLGTHGSFIVDADGSGVAVGVSVARRFGVSRAVVVDTTAATLRAVDRGALGADDASVEVEAADDQVLVGALDGEPVAWPVGDTVRLHDPAVDVQESAGAVQVRVLRTGDLSRPTSVRYTTAGGTARPDRDFSPVAGTVTFASGQSVATIRVPVRDDVRPEVLERFQIRLIDPSPGERLLTARSTVAIPASDQRPDSEISTAARRGYIGDGIYNSTGQRQTKTRQVRRGGTSNFFVRIHNDGNAAITVAVRPRRVPDGVRVRYYSAGKDVTAAVTGPGGWKTHLQPDRRRVVRVKISVARTVRAGASRSMKVASVWSGDRTRLDVVRATVKVRR